MSEAYLLCRRCGVLHPVPTDGSADDEAMQDLAAFRAEAEQVLGIERKKD